MIIGITGKIGSGKSFIGEYMAEKTGYKLVKLDYQAGQVANKKFFKKRLEKKIKTEIPPATPDMQLFPLFKNLEKDFGRFEIAVFIYCLNRKLKKILKENNEKIIVDFVSLPILKSVKMFDKVYLIKSDEELRYQRLGERDGMTPEHAREKERFMEKYYECHDTYQFDAVIENNYIEIPREIDEVIDRLKGNNIS